MGVVVVRWRRGGGGGDGRGEGSVGWLEDRRSPAAGGFSVCLLACLLVFPFFLFISNCKERILVAGLRTDLVRGTKTAMQEKTKVHVSVNVDYVRKKQTFQRGRQENKPAVLRCLYKV